ncbi:hypothetical protein ACSVDA_14255 [Cytobacillus sp. Hm23]
MTYVIYGFKKIIYDESCENENVVYSKGNVVEYHYPDNNITENNPPSQLTDFLHQAFENRKENEV